MPKSVGSKVSLMLAALILSCCPAAGTTHRHDLCIAVAMGNEVRASALQASQCDPAFSVLLLAATLGQSPAIEWMALRPAAQCIV